MVFLSPIKFGVPGADYQANHKEKTCRQQFQIDNSANSGILILNTKRIYSISSLKNGV